MCRTKNQNFWWGGGPCDYSVSPSPFDLDFGTLDFGTSDSGLTISILHGRVLQVSYNEKTKRSKDAKLQV